MLVILAILVILVNLVTFFNFIIPVVLVNSVILGKLEDFGESAGSKEYNDSTESADFGDPCEYG